MSKINKELKNAFLGVLKQAYEIGYGDNTNIPEMKPFATSSIAITGVFLSTPMLDMLRTNRIDYFISKKGQFVISQ